MSAARPRRTTTTRSNRSWARRPTSSFCISACGRASLRPCSRLLTARTGHDFRGRGKCVPVPFGAGPGRPAVLVQTRSQSADADVSELQDRSPWLGNLDVGVAAGAHPPLEDRDAKEPNADDGFCRSADVLLVVGVEVALLAQPGAELLEAAADGHVRFNRRPAR